MEKQIKALVLLFFSSASSFGSSSSLPIHSPAGSDAEMISDGEMYEKINIEEGEEYQNIQRLTRAERKAARLRLKLQNPRHYKFMKEVSRLSSLAHHMNESKQLDDDEKQELASYKDRYTKKLQEKENKKKRRGAQERMSSSSSSSSSSSRSSSPYRSRPKSPVSMAMMAPPPPPPLPAGQIPNFAPTTTLPNPLPKLGAGLLSEIAKGRPLKKPSDTSNNPKQLTLVDALSKKIGKRRKDLEGPGSEEESESKKEEWE